MTIITALSPDTFEPVEFQLALERPGAWCRLAVQALPGSGGGAQFIVDDEAREQRFRVELPFRPSGRISNEKRITISVSETDRLALSTDTTTTRYFLLPWSRDSRKDNQGHLPALPDPRTLQLLVLVDGSSRMLCEHAEGDPREPGIEPCPIPWSKHLGQIAELAHALAGELPNPSYTVIAYGDKPIPAVRAQDLIPTYQLFPRDETLRREFRPYHPDALRRDLGAIEYTPGGDFIDALGEALHECASRIDWDPSPKTLRVLLITGESPGLSLPETPSTPALPAGADGLLDRQDIETPLARLHHERRVDVISIYQNPGADSPQPATTHAASASAWSEGQVLLEYARRQFLNQLPSHPDFGCEAAHLDPGQLAGRVRKRREPTRRYSGLGIVRVLEQSD